MAQDKVKQGMYPHGEAFDRDLAKIFSDARRWISRDDRLRWGDTMAVQRLWQEITKVDSVLLNPHSASSLPKSAKKAGAATGVAMAPVTKATKSERIVLEYINFKGDTVRAGERQARPWRRLMA